MRIRPHFLESTVHRVESLCGSQLAKAGVWESGNPNARKQMTALTEIEIGRRVSPLDYLY